MMMGARPVVAMRLIWARVNGDGGSLGKGRGRTPRTCAACLPASNAHPNSDPRSPPRLFGYYPEPDRCLMSVAPCRVPRGHARVDGPVCTFSQIRNVIIQDLHFDRAPRAPTLCHQRLFAPLSTSHASARPEISRRVYRSPYHLTLCTPAGRAARREVEVFRSPSRYKVWIPSHVHRIECEHRAKWREDHSGGNRTQARQIAEQLTRQPPR